MHNHITTINMICTYMAVWFTQFKLITVLATCQLSSLLVHAKNCMSRQINTYKRVTAILYFVKLYITYEILHNDMGIIDNYIV